MQQITDDGETFAYVVDPEALGQPSSIWMQPVHSDQRHEITDNQTALGGLVMSDDGNRIYTRTNRQFGAGSGLTRLLVRKYFKKIKEPTSPQHPIHYPPSATGHPGRSDCLSYRPMTLLLSPARSP